MIHLVGADLVYPTRYIKNKRSSFSVYTHVGRGIVLLVKPNMLAERQF